MKRTVWTKQHKDILNILKKKGRFIAMKEYILQGKEDISRFYFESYRWYAERASKIVDKPEDVHYSIWVSLNKESILGLDPDTVLLEIEIDSDRVVEMDYSKWGYVVNYYYIPENEKDNQRHNELLDKYEIDDSTAYMTSFYPHIKKEIIKSWDSLFDKSRFNSREKVGTIWEIKSQWIKNITHYKS